MKEIIDGNCRLCNFSCRDTRGLFSHIRRKHPEYDAQKYYLQFFPNYCKICKKLIPYKEKYYQYMFCSQECLGEEFRNNIPTNKGDRKYKEEFLLNHLKELYMKYGRPVTQRLVREHGILNYQTYHEYFGSFSKACELAEVPHFVWSYTPKKETAKDSLFTIVVDTREGIPYPFKNHVRRKMDVGDYCLDEISTGVVIERKELGDLKGCLTTSKKRFMRELDRARANKQYVIVLIDASFEMFIKIPNFSHVSNKQLFGIMKRLGAEYNDVCQFLFTGGRKQSAELVYPLCVCDSSAYRAIDIQEYYDNGTLLSYLHGEGDGYSYMEEESKI